MKATLESASATKFAELINQAIAPVGLFGTWGTITLHEDQILGDWALKPSQLRQMAIDNFWLILEELVGLPAWDYTFAHDAERYHAFGCQINGLTAQDAKNEGWRVAFSTECGFVLGEPKSWQVRHELKLVERELPMMFWPNGIATHLLAPEQKFESFLMWEAKSCSMPVVESGFQVSHLRKQNQIAKA